MTAEYANLNDSKRLNSFLDDEDLHTAVTFSEMPDDAACRKRNILERMRVWLQPPYRLLLWRGEHASQGFAVYRRSLWDSEAFGVSSGFLEAVHATKPSAYDALVPEVLERLVSDGEVFITRKAPLSRGPEIRANENAGFRLADCELVFCRDNEPDYRQNPCAIPPGVEIVCNVPLTGQDFSLPFHPNRFSSDPQIGPGKARELWQGIVRNCLGFYGDRRYVALFRGRPVGLVALFETKLTGISRPIGRIFLVGCVPEWQGKGLMRLLMDRVIAHAQQAYHRLVVETSAVNHRAQSFYLKSGFQRIIATRVSMHYWTR